MKKREFRETKQPKITDETLEQNVCDVEEFEYTSAQKFVSQFMSPNTPYNGMLLYHGVGVGKTCSAILAAESFLQLSPKNKVYILAPPAIQAGFYRTIFDSSRIKFGNESDEQNQHDGCTGNRYLDLTQTLYERDKKDIELRVNRLINKRYSIMGYVAFRNMVRDILSQIPSTLSPERKQQQRVTLLQRALSGCFFIVDEAHNLRDVSETEDDTDQVDDVGDRSDASAGKKLAPMLREVLKTCEGIKLMLMSATPMYNNYKEIVSLLNLLLYVDKVDESELLRESDIVFDKEVLTPESEAKIVKVANGHVSFMRGENPRAFPSRLDPAPELRVQSWPTFAPNGTLEIKPESQKENVLQLPLVKCELTGEPLEVIKNLTEKLVEAKGVGIRTIDTLLQAGNCIFPGEGLDGRVGSEGFQTWFSTKAIPASFEGTRLNTLPQYVPADPDESYNWMIASDDGLGKASPKFNRVLKTIRTATGISFVYSRFVENGAVIFCLLLEANGYTPWGRSAPLFSKGSISGGRQCCKCDKRESNHPPYILGQQESRENHKFMPAYYALLTASDVNTVEKQSLPLSPNNTAVINMARSMENKDGHKIKVIVGSQVAGEGVDLRFIREVHILEGWFHLSKEEQIVGRGIRYCSHNALPKVKRNCTINLYVNTFPENVNKETIDLYSYRTAMNKAVRVGNVSRALKMGAADCNLNRDMILVTGLTEKPALDASGNPNMIDSQGQPRPVNLNDKDFTPTCDWITCNYVCKPSFNLDDKVQMPDDNGTYDMFAARFAEQMMVNKLKKLFKDQPWFHLNKLQDIFKDIPKATLTSLLLRVVNNQSIMFENGNLQGHIIFRNGLFLFQPNKIKDNAIPFSFRYGRYPVKRDSYNPTREIVKAKNTSSLENTRNFWNTAVSWVNFCYKPGVATACFTKHSVNQSDHENSPIDYLSHLFPGNKPDVMRAHLSQFGITGKLATNLMSDTLKEDKNSRVASDLASALDLAITKFIPKNLYDVIVEYVERDDKKKENIKMRLEMLQWWGKAITRRLIGKDKDGIDVYEAYTVPNGLDQLNKIAKEFIWDSFFKGSEHIQLLNEDLESAKSAASEQILNAGSINAVRYMDIGKKEPIYQCSGAPCPPSVLKLFTDSKIDPVVNARANKRVSANPYGFMVVWENDIMFKTNDAKNEEGKPPGSGAACSIVSNVKGHRMKLVQLGDILVRYHDGNRFELTEESLKSLNGAPSFCALMEIIMRWMDLRKSSYGGKRYFYRPLSSYYSGHKSKK